VKSRPFSLCTAASPEHSGETGSDSSSGAPEETDTADIRCTITRGIENWFLTGDTNDPDSIETVAQIGWFQVLKGYVQKSGL
jgi:hypothetical protein